MRTTLEIDDDVLDKARQVARSEGRSLGSVVSEYARRGMFQFAVETHGRFRFPTFPVPPNAKPFGLDEVKRALEDEW